MASQLYFELVLDFCIFHGYNNPIVNEQTLIYNISEYPLKNKRMRRCVDHYSVKFNQVSAYKIKLLLGGDFF